MQLKYALAITIALASTGAIAQGQGSKNAQQNLRDQAENNASTQIQTRNASEAYSLQRLDANNDGVISRSEFDSTNNPNRDRFNQADSNRDGNISNDELNKFNGTTYGVKNNSNQ